MLIVRTLVQIADKSAMNFRHAMPTAATSHAFPQRANPCMYAAMTYADYLALAFFVIAWASFNWLTGVNRSFSRVSLSRAMAVHRANWIRNSLTRDLKMVDTQIMAGLQNGTAFFCLDLHLRARRLFCASGRHRSGSKRSSRICL